MRRRLWLAAATNLLLIPAGKAATFHVDPARGSMTAPGSEQQPWSTLEAVFAANKSFAAGDEIVLHEGYHGAPTVSGNNAGTVTIRPAAGEVPKLKSLLVRSASRWDLAGLDICPEHAAPGTSQTGTLVEIEGSASRITLRDCLLRGAFDLAGWTLNDWDNVGRGIRTAAPYTTLSGNRIEAVTFGLTVRKTAPFTEVTGNTIKGFSHDGIQALADDCLFESNTITDAYISDSSHNHDDFFQSWSVNGDGTVGEGTVARITLRGNIFISRTDPAQLLPANPQGIGCFDGYYEGWVIENNIIASRTYHGIALYGAIDCKVVNNTVVENPLDAAGGTTRPWIKVAAHKTRTATSAGNLVRNNISAKPVDAIAGSSTVDFHHTTTAYGTYFKNHTAFDFSLKATAPAKDAGTAAEAPALDITGKLRSAPYDLGAHEYAAATGATGPTYAQWLQANGLPGDGSGDGAKGASPAGDGVANELKFALGLPANSQGYRSRVVTGITTESGQDYLTLSFSHPDPAPAGVSYAVTTSPDLATWSAGVEISNTAADGLRTRTFRDTVPLSAGEQRRLIRLEVAAP